MLLLSNDVICSVKGLTCRAETTENYPPTTRFLSAQSILASLSSFIRISLYGDWLAFGTSSGNLRNRSFWAFFSLGGNTLSTRTSQGRWYITQQLATSGPSASAHTFKPASSLGKRHAFRTRRHVAPLTALTCGTCQTYLWQREIKSVGSPKQTTRARAHTRTLFCTVVCKSQFQLRWPGCWKLLVHEPSLENITCTSWFYSFMYVIHKMKSKMQYWLNIVAHQLQFYLPEPLCFCFLINSSRLLF